MKNSIKTVALGLLLLTIGLGCEKYKTQFEGPYSDSGGGVARPVNYEIAYCAGGKVFMTDKFLRFTKQLPGISGATKVSINDAHDRIAYKSAVGNITVVDSAGAAVSVIAGSGAVDWFDFHGNNRTVYMLEGHKLKFDGPAIQVAPTNLEGVLPYFSNDYEITAGAVAPNGTVVFGYKVYTGFNYEHGVWWRRMDGQDTKAVLSYETPFRLRLANQTGDYVISALTGISDIKYYTGNFNSTSLYGDYGNAIYAFSPDAQGLLYAYESGPGGSTIVEKYTGRQLVTDTGFITDLDW